MTLFKKYKKLSLFLVCMHCIIYKYIHNEALVLLGASNVSTESTEDEVKQSQIKTKVLYTTVIMF